MENMSEDHPFPSRWKGLGAIHLAVLLFGLAGLFAEWVQLPASWIVLGRTGFAALFLLGLLPLMGMSYAPARPADRGKLLLSGGLLAFHWVAFFHSIQLSSVALGLLTFSAFPIFTVMLEPLFGQGKMRAIDIVIGIVTLLGVALIMPPLDWQLTTTQGALWGLTAGLSFAVLAISNRGLVVHNPGRRIALWQNSVAFLCLLPTVWLQPSQPRLQDWSLLLLLGILFTGVSHSLFIDGLRRVPARTASVIASMEPVYGILAAFWLLGDRPSSSTWLGGSIIVGASVYASARRDRS
jgi:drug/metabolite transporter (DMT)-like permease